MEAIDLKQTRTDSVLTELVRLKVLNKKSFYAGNIAKRCNLKNGRAAGIRIQRYCNQLGICKIDERGNYGFIKLTEIKEQA